MDGIVGEIHSKLWCNTTKLTCFASSYDTKTGLPNRLSSPFEANNLMIDSFEILCVDAIDDVHDVGCVRAYQLTTIPWLLRHRSLDHSAAWITSTFVLQLHQITLFRYISAVWYSHNDKRLGLAAYSLASASHIHYFLFHSWYGGHSIRDD